MSDSDTDPEESLDLFADPPDYYPPSPTPTTETYTLLAGSAVSVRLVGHNPLWGHHLWNAGRILSEYLESNVSLIQGRTVLELGAGAGLPSLICASLGANKVVVTDYPDPDLIENLWYNIDHSGLNEGGVASNKDDADGKRIVAEGYTWGADPASLLSHITKTSLQSTTETTTPAGFDVLILADLLFNHSEHTKLVSTIQRTLSHSSAAKALVFFTPYRPWLLSKDLTFFDLMREAGFAVEKVLETKMEKVMFEKDPGDEELRRTVFGYAVTRENQQ
ncbi:MAG: nicotinamide n-methyltransferase [Claussenomyces sp. TS43310]|nr:MAG: nicotinamide n-methyltransferase [Claussenomyces sp. TS43310]